MVLRNVDILRTTLRRAHLSLFRNTVQRLFAKKDMDYARLRLFPTRAQSRRFDNGLSFDLHHAAGSLPSNRRDNASNLYVFRLNTRHRQYREVFETKQSRLFLCKGDKPNLRQRFYADVNEYDARNLRRRQYPTAEYHSTHL